MAGNVPPTAPTAVSPPAPDAAWHERTVTPSSRPVPPVWHWKSISVFVRFESSAVYGNEHLKGQDRVIDTCRAEHASDYVNATGDDARAAKRN